MIFRASIPVDHHAVKKNSRVIMTNRATGKPFIGKSKELSVAEKSLLIRLRAAAIKNKIYDPIRGDIHVKFTFYCKNFFTKKNERSKNLADLSNLLECPSDCLTQAQIIEDDWQIRSFDGSRILPGEQNILEIEIYPFTETLTK